MAKRTKADWWYSYPDDRNRLIEEAREILLSLTRGRGAREGLEAWKASRDGTMKAARRWLKETKP